MKHYDIQILSEIVEKHYSDLHFKVLRLCHENRELTIQELSLSEDDIKDALVAIE